MRFWTAASYLFMALQVGACGSTPSTSGGGASGRRAGADGGIGDPPDAGEAGAVAPVDAGTRIEHLIVIVQENHTFDDHFGAYCKAPPGSSPTCNDGPSCCEAMPSKDPSGTPPTVLTDTAIGSYDPNHAQGCELAEMDDGKMDRYVTAPGCGNPRNIAVADPTIIKPYWSLAAEGALADRYFQSVAGASYANDMSRPIPASSTRATSRSNTSRPRATASAR
jgi:phospholipase C